MNSSSLAPRRNFLMDVIAMVLVTVCLLGMMMYVHQGIQQYDESTLTYMTTIKYERDQAKKNGVSLTETVLARSADTIKAYPRIMIFLIVYFLAFSFWGLKNDAHIQSPLCAIFLLLGIGCSIKVLCHGFPGLTGEAGFLMMGCLAMAATFFIWRSLGFNLSNKLYWILVGLVTAMIILNWVAIIRGEKNPDELENGAANWVTIGSINIQPSEFIKAGLHMLGSCCNGKKIRKIVYCLFSALGCFTVIKGNDIGTAFIIALMFVMMVIVLFDEEWLNIALAVCAVVGFFLVIRESEVAVERMAAWGTAMTNTDHIQQRDFITAIIRGGWSGLGMKEASRYFVIYSAGSDGALGAVQAIYGLPMLLVTFASYLTLVCVAGFSRNVNRTTQPFLLQLSLMITAQVLLNYLGSLDVLPFTGIVAPLVSQGGTSILCNMSLMGVMLAALHSKVSVPTTYPEVHK